MVRKAQKTGEAESPEIAKVAATIKRKDAKDIASTKHKGLPMKKEELTTEAKVDKGRSDYGKASIRNYRRKGPGHSEPGMFDPEGKRGKTIELRRSEHKARRGVKGAKVPKYKVNEEGYDHYRDKKLEQGTWKEPERKNPPRKPMTDAQKKIDRANSKTALDIVKKNIRDKYGKDAIWEPKKTKKEEVELQELSRSTLSSYIQKGARDIAGKANDASIKGMSGKRKEADKGYEKTAKRVAGVSKAAGKLALKGTIYDKSKNEEVEPIDELSKNTTANYLYHARVDKDYVHSGKMGKYQKARDKGIKRAEKKLGKKVSDRVRYVADYDTRSMRDDPNKSAYPRKMKVKEEVQVEGTKYGLYKGDGKPKGAMAAFAKKKEDKKPNPYGKRAKLKMLIKGFAEKNRMKSGNIAKEEREGNKTWKEFLDEGNRTSRQLTKSKTQTTGNIAADRGNDEKKNRESRKGLEKDLKKKGIGYSKGVGEYKYKKDGKEGTKQEVSYQTTPAEGMSKRRFGKVMRRLGRKYDQESVITKKAGKSAQLHDTQSKQNKADKSFALGKSKPGKNPSKEGETSGTKVRSGKLPKKTKGAMHYGN